MTARRAILRKPIDRIGYGGYLKLALEFPEFIDYIESVCDEFRTLYSHVKGAVPYCVGRVAVLSSWGNMRAGATTWSITRSIKAELFLFRRHRGPQRRPL